MKLKLQSLALVACLAVCGAAWPAAKPKPITRPAYNAEKARIAAQYEADRKLCAAVKRQVQDVCEAEATGRQKALLADLDARLKPSPEANQKARNITATRTTTWPRPNANSCATLRRTAA